MGGEVAPPRPPRAKAAPRAPHGRPKPWAVYLLRCGDGSLYAGVTNDLRARLAAHRGKDGAARGAKYTRGRGPLRLVWSQPAAGRSEAHRLEWRLKRLTRAEKLALVRRRGRLAPAPRGSG